MKTCRTCKIDKDLDEYYKAERTKDGKDSRCKICCLEVSKEKYKNTPKQYVYKKKEDTEYNRCEVCKIFLKKGEILYCSPECEENRFYYQNREIIKKLNKKYYSNNN